MKYIIFPEDKSVDFMRVVLIYIKDLISDGSVIVIGCEASDAGYSKAIKEINSIPDGSVVIFIGHSTPNSLYGGENSLYHRKSLIEIDSMSIFKNKKLILVSCFSRKLLASSRKYRNYSSCVGFGLLPSELNEISAHSGMRRIGLEQEDINMFKIVLGGIISKVIYYIFDGDNTLEQAFSYFKIIANKKINELVLDVRNEKLAEILFYVVNEALLE